MQCGGRGPDCALSVFCFHPLECMKLIAYSSIKIYFKICVALNP